MMTVEIHTRDCACRVARIELLSMLKNADARRLGQTRGVKRDVTRALAPSAAKSYLQICRRRATAKALNADV